MRLPCSGGRPCATEGISTPRPRLSETTDPNLVFNLRAKLVGAGHYDDFEVERVVAVELAAKATQSELLSAVEPVVDRLLHRYKAAQGAWTKAKSEGRDDAAKDAQSELEALQLFRADMGAYLRLYGFLSQIFDYGTTALEKRAIFFRRVLPLLEFGREREGIDLSKVTLTHHALKSKGKQAMMLGGGQSPKLAPIIEVGAGGVQEREKAQLREIIEKVNDLFVGELTEGGKRIYAPQVIGGKLLESETLRQQAASNTKEQFTSSPDLVNEGMEAAIGAYDAHTAMSQQLLNDPTKLAALRRVLMENGLWEQLRARHAQ